MHGRADAGAEPHDVERLVLERLGERGQEELRAVRLGADDAALGDRERLEPGPVDRLVAEPCAELDLAHAADCERLRDAAVLQQDDVRACRRRVVADEREQVVRVGGGVLDGQRVPGPAQGLDLFRRAGDTDVEAHGATPRSEAFALPACARALRASRRAR